MVIYIKSGYLEQSRNRRLRALEACRVISSPTAMSDSAANIQGQYSVLLPLSLPAFLSIPSSTTLQISISTISLLRSRPLLSPRSLSSQIACSWPISRSLQSTTSPYLLGRWYRLPDLTRTTEILGWLNATSCWSRHMVCFNLWFPHLPYRS